MKLIWHIVKKDALRLRWPLAFWLGLRLILMAFVLAAPSMVVEGADPDRVVAIVSWGTNLLGNIVLYLMSYMLVMSLLDEDSVVRHDAFWKTRPISGGRLLAAKLLGMVVLLWLLPMAVMLPWWLGHGYGFRELGIAACEMLWYQSIPTLIAFPIAALSRSSGVFLGLSLVAVLGNLVLMSLFAGGKDWRRFSSEVLGSQLLLILGIMILAVVVAVLNQFLSRRIWRSVVAIVLGVAMSVSVIKFWHWDFPLKLIQRMGTQPVVLPARFTSAHYSQSLRRRIEQPASVPSSNDHVSIRYEMEGLKGMQVPVVQSSEIAVRWNDRTVHNEMKMPIGSVRVKEPKAALALLTGAKMPPSWGRTHTWMLKETALIERLLKETPACELTISGQIYEPRIVAEVALREGMSVNNSGFGLRIEKVETRGGGDLSVLTREHNPEFATGESPMALGITSGSSVGSGELGTEMLCVINRKMGGVLVATTRTRGEMFSLGSVRRFQGYIVFMPSSYVSAPAADSFVEWLRDAVLVKIVFQKVGDFRSIITTPRLEIEPEKSRLPSTTPAPRSP